ncbi:MAG: hypothetical protein DRJ61_10175 [Acidobacteria bacterium]|nr:MAG: hypothetical protein DRJ61_10175 [Acidobacteriota bacterium]
MLTLVLAVSSVVGAADLSSAGIAVDVESSMSELGAVVVEIVWTQGANEAFLALKAPEGVEAIIEGGRLIAAGERISLGTFGPDQEMRVEVFGLEEGGEALLVAERSAGPESYQSVIDIKIKHDNAVLAGSREYLIRPAREADFIAREESRDQPHAARAAEPGRDAIVIEALIPKILATIFVEDPSNHAIPDGPGNCADAGGVWPVESREYLYIGSAPAGATSTAITVHVEITHPVMADLQVAFGRADSLYTTFWLNYLLRYDPGVNLDRDFTRDKYSNNFMALGDAVNGYYQLAVRDCVAADTGTLTYFSVLVEYDGALDVDLVADSVSVDPGTAAAGDDIRVTWAGHVGGTDSIAGGFNTRIYLSNDTNITTADTPLATVNEAAASDPGDTFGDGAPGRTVTLPPGVSDGTKYIGIIVDSNDAVDESNESNNSAWDAITIDSTSSLDLVADSITPQTGSVAAGASVNVNWFGHADAGNSGDISGNFTVGFYLSNDATVTTGDTLLDRVTISGPTTPGESFGASGRSLSIPGGTAAGTRYLGLIVDDTGSVAETNENNNTATSAITVTGGGGGQADLVTTACSVSPTSVEVGDLITVNWTERNQGDVEAPAFLTRIYLSTNPVWEGPSTDTRLIQFDHGPYAAGFQQSLNTSVTIPAGTSDGTWYILVVTDARDVVPESNEDNNMCASTITVGSGGGTGSTDRWLIPAAASAPGYSGSDWRTQIAITNPGNQTREATVYYVSDSASWPGTLLSGPISIGARRSHYIDDVLRNLRPTAGLLYVVLDDPGPVVTSRTYNLASDGSTFGQGIPGVPLISGDAPDELILPMVHSGGGRYHTNLGLVHASSGSMTVEISIYTAGGSLLAVQQRTVTDGWDQINDVFDKMGVGAASIEGGWIKVRMISGSPDAWTCYASVVDKETGDPTYVAGVEAE